MTGTLFASLTQPDIPQNKHCLGEQLKQPHGKSLYASASPLHSGKQTQEPALVLSLLSSQAKDLGGWPWIERRFFGPSLRGKPSCSSRSSPAAAVDTASRSTSSASLFPKCHQQITPDLKICMQRQHFHPEPLQFEQRSEDV